MALPTVRPILFPGSLVRVTPLLQPLGRAAERVFNTCGRSGAIAEASHIRSLPPRTRLTRQPLRLSIILQCQRQPEARSLRLADGRTVDRVFRLVQNQSLQLV